MGSAESLSSAPTRFSGRISRLTRRRTRIIVLIGVMLTIVSAFYYFAPGNNFASLKLSKGTESEGGMFNKLFDIDAVNRYLSNANKETKKLEKENEVKGAQLQVKINEEQEALLNNAEELRKLYFNSDHNGIINFGSTGNMGKPELNILKNKDSKNKLQELLHDGKDGKTSNNKEEPGGDRSIPLTDEILPDEDAFAKIDTEQLIKGDLTFQNFFGQILKLISKNHLSFPLERRMKLKDGKPIIDEVFFFEQSYDRLSEHDLYGLFEFPQNFISDLKLKHENVVRGIPDVVPHFYKGDGYVTVGGGIYSWYALLGIETLRKVGSKLPVEVFLPELKDYEFEFCEVILPKLNARCIEMYKIFGAQSLQDFDVQGYQYKAFALLASSFENAFLLDSDSYPVTNPDPLFESELYKEYQMITWPDFWRRTVSPYFYEISNTEIGMVPVRHLNDFFVNPKYLEYKQGDDIVVGATYHDRAGTIPDWTTESGEMLINKRKHFRTLILALYYNYDGPYGYYPLLSQGGAGEGDKETFVAAANFYGLKWYQVNKKCERHFGWYNDEQNYEHSTIVQYDPISDYDLLQKSREMYRKDVETAGDSYEYNYDKYFLDFFTPDALNPMFYHVHDPKMNPFKIMEKKWTENLDGKKIRNVAEDFPRVHFDLELFLWGTINHYMCDTSTNFRAFDGQDKTELCNKFMPDQLAYLKFSSQKIFDAYKSENYQEQIKGGRDWT